MNLKNIRVNHKAFGQGIIIEKEESYITVKFYDGKKRFRYPDVFERYLTTPDNNIENMIKKDIAYFRKTEEEKNKELKKKLAKKEEERQNLLNLKQENKRNIKIYPRANIAFKCNYCDGGRSESQVGFNGICSDRMIKNNIEIEKRTWCNSLDCECLDYLEGRINRRQLDDIHNTGGYVCYESQMLRDWKALAGIVQRGERAGQPMKLHKVQSNSLCVLTSRMPETKEEERFIFAVFLIDDSYEGDNREEGYVSTKSKYKLKLTPKEAEGFLFWDYHANNNKPEVATWSSGLHRYFEDIQAIQILKDILMIKKGTEDQDLAEEFLKYFSKINNIDIHSIPEKNGALKRK